MKAIVLRHLEAFNEGQLDATLADYADSVTIITPGGITKGKEEAKKLFAKILSAPSDKRAHLLLKSRFFSGKFGYVNWSQNEGTETEVQGSDTFVVEGGKIVAQTVMAVAVPRPSTTGK